MCRGGRATIEVPAIALACLALALTQPGCLLNVTGLGYNVYNCGATLRNDAGETVDVSTSDSRFGGGFLPAADDCGMTTIADVEGYWHKMLKDVVDTDASFVGRGTWCFEEVTCEESGFGGWPPVCPASLPDVTLDECGPLATRCLSLDPPPSPEEPTFDIYLDFGTLDVGDYIESRFVTIVNEDCRGDVRVRVDGEIAGPQAGDFSLWSNACGPDDPTACGPDDPEACWHTLAPDESCDLSFGFRPLAHGPRGGRSLFVRDDEPGRYSLALRGRGQGGFLATPERECLDQLVAPRAECDGAQATAWKTISLTHESGPDVEVLSIRADGAFRVDESMAPFTVPAGGAIAVDVLWCATAGDVEDTGALELETDGANRPDGTLSIELHRTTGRCP